MPHKAIPANAPRLSEEAWVGSAPVPVDVETGRKAAWTKVTGTVVKGVQTEEGANKGQPIWRITADCPKCSDAITVTSTLEHGDYPIRCECSRHYVFLIAW
jgi:hypothetical protein